MTVIVSPAAAEAPVPAIRSLETSFVGALVLGTVTFGSTESFPLLGPSMRGGSFADTFCEGRDGKSPKPDTYEKTGPDVGRNDPCHCGSGKKFKKCHGKA